MAFRKENVRSLPEKGECRDRCLNMRLWGVVPQTLDDGARKGADHVSVRSLRVGVMMGFYCMFECR